MSSNRFVLASSSPRRRELFKLLGIPFTVFEPKIEEVFEEGKPEDLVEEIAVRKAQVFKGDGTVVAADTVVVFEDKLLGKPRDEEEAYEMLLLLRGKPHLVITGVAILSSQGIFSAHSTTRVLMREYSDEEMRVYISSGKAKDKAGAYAIQDRYFKPVASYEGCYSNVVGLPLCTLVRTLRRSGFELRDFQRLQECIGCQAKEKL